MPFLIVFLGGVALGVAVTRSEATRRIPKFLR